MQRSKIFLLVLLAGAVALFFALGLHQSLSLDALRASQARLQAWHAQAPLTVMALFFAVYVLVTALSLPGAAVLTLAGGAAFGLGWGTLLVSVASTAGATLAMLAARFLLQGSVQARFGPRLADLNAGIAREGAFYLFTLRLLPIVPFFALNLLMGLTRMRTWTYVWVSQIGMLPGTLAYVNAGTELARIESLRDVLSPGLLGAFAALGLLPLVAKKLLDAWRARRVYAPWRAQRPRQFDRNLVVIGAGAAGLVTAYIAAAVKARVTLVEAHAMGGDCLNTGCVPSKALIRSARLAHQMRHASRFGLQDTEPAVAFRAVLQRVRAVVGAITPHDSIERYTALGVEVLQGHARLVSPWAVEITAPDGSVQTLTTRSIVLATGAQPFVPSLPGLAEAGCLTSDTLWAHLETLDAPPARLLVLGGGPIGCELAQALQRLGAQVTLVEQAERLLLREDADVSATVAAALQADGVTLHTGQRALRCERHASGGHVLVVQPASGGPEQAIGFDTILCAVGRTARLQGYGLEALGISAERVITHNAALQTRFPNIYVAGDAAGPYQFTHVAAHQAWYAAVNALFGRWRRFSVDYRVIPSVTFTDPEIARVGLNRQEAMAQGVAFEVSRYGLDDLDRAITDGEAHGWIEVLTVPGKDRILGATLVGSHAGELLAEFVLAMKHNLGLNRILGTIHAYPTWVEGNKYVAGHWKRAHAPERLLRWVQRYHRWERGSQ